MDSSIKNNFWNYFDLLNVGSCFTISLFCRVKIYYVNIMFRILV